MGRSVANEAFLRALLRKDPFDAYHFFLMDRRQRDILRQRFMHEYPAMLESGRLLVQTFEELPQALAETEYHCFHLSDCLMHSAQLARLRNAVARSVFPITGVTHSMSYARYVPMLLRQMWQGCTPRDVIVPTSRAAFEMLERQFNLLRQRYQLPESFEQPRLERIPLGIDVPSFPDEKALPDRSGRYIATEYSADEFATAFSGTGDYGVLPGDFALCDANGAAAKDNDCNAGDIARGLMRQKIGARQDDVVLLTFARISHFSKMDIVPLLRAVRRMADNGVPLERICVVLAGFVGEKESAPELLTTLAQSWGIRFTIVEKPSDAERNALYAAADIFVSPVDNIQETFGLTMLEAGAMGLPVVASDFDGYRDLIVHGETGYLIPTYGPENTQSVDEFAHFAFDSATHLELAQQTIVDVPELAARLSELAASSELRRIMGRKACQLVRSEYDWDIVLNSYLDLWKHCHTLPVDQDALRKVAHPQDTSYGHVFGTFASHQLSSDRKVQWTVSGEAVYRKKEVPVIYGNILGSVNMETLSRMLFMCRKPIRISELSVRLNEPAEKSEVTDFIIQWAVKQDYLEFVSD